MLRYGYEGDHMAILLGFVSAALPAWLLLFRVF
jgi:hypothetical protein